MGMTLHKVMGWALTDVVTTDEGGWHRLGDPRINADSRLFDYDDDATAVDYLRFLCERKTSVARTDSALDPAFDAFLDSSILRDRLHASTHPWTLAQPWKPVRDLAPGRAVTHCSEYGNPAVLVLRPVTCTDWQRRNDPLDHAEEMLSGRYTEGQVQVMPHAPYPFSGAWMDAHTGARLPDTVMTWVRLASRLRDEPDLPEVDRRKIEQAMAAIAEASLDFTDGSAAVDRVVPCVPGEVRTLAEFGNLFTSGDVWRQLRPVIYTYWS